MVESSTGRPHQAPWDAGAVRRLRGHLGATQAELADQLGTRQQTVSEWETGTSAPRRMSRRLLHLVAESSGFYDAGPGPEAETAPGDASSSGELPA
ncbi:MAG: helix-turn-helix domain-containing protein [Chloroflexi bacterium]|nr:helix-turn-helix domain-containing protein [Chloroflexota bacterium]MDA1241500.1 helix-turn-helix domain-containing protein [Chloroflexota bacterium]